MLTMMAMMTGTTKRTMMMVMTWWQWWWWEVIGRHGLACQLEAGPVTSQNQPATLMIKIIAMISIMMTMMMMRLLSSSSFVRHHRNHTAKIIDHHDHWSLPSEDEMNRCAFSEFCLNYFFPHCIDYQGVSLTIENCFVVLAALLWKVSRETFLLRFFRRVALKYRGRDNSFPWITMSNKPARSGLVNSIIKASRHL